MKSSRRSKKIREAPARAANVDPARARRQNWLTVALCAGLGLIVWAVFGQTLRHGFINYDDGSYVYKNPIVSSGLTWEGLIWAFTQTHSANWHPLTWISHMLDCELFGLRPAGHHFTNVLLHSATAILLFLVLSDMTGRVWRSATVAALFAVHPLRVESVAWVAERKDVLSGLLFVLTLAAYVRYARKPSRRAYLLVLLLFALGLMSKPMLVTVPVVLLILDYWPLQRFGGKDSAAKLVFEKLPLLGVAAVSAAVTIFAQKMALQAGAHLPLPLRVGNAVISPVTYVRQMFWPSGLIPFYPFDPAAVSAARILLALVCLAGISAAAFLLRRHRYLAAGWLWYLVMLLPVIGIVQVGPQAHADRYTYLPQIGLALAITWGVADLSGRWRHARFALAAAATTSIGALAFLADKQAAYWRESETLWTRTLAVSPNNVIAQQDLADALAEKGRGAEAIAHLERAVALEPDQAVLHSALGALLLETGRKEESLTHLQTAVRLAPSDAGAHYNLANTLTQIGREADAVAHYSRALEQNPVDTEALNNMAWLLATARDPAVRDGAKAVALAERADSLTRRVNPLNAATLAAAYAECGRFDEAVRAARRALDLATQQGNAALANSIRRHIRAYESRSPLR